jgi:hypothetical protein
MITQLDEMYTPVIKNVLNTQDGREFLTYILRKLHYCDLIADREDLEIRNAGIRLLEDLMQIAGIRVNVLKIE